MCGQQSAMRRSGTRRGNFDFLRRAVAEASRSCNVRGPMRLAVALGAFLAAAALGAACTPNPYKDSHCSPDSPSIAVDANCIYAGDGKGPAFKEPACPAPTGNPPAMCPTFNDVFNIMTDYDPTLPAVPPSTMPGAFRRRGSCTLGACHGDPNVDTDGIFLDAGDPAGFYQRLTTITGTVGRPYVSTANPSASWIQCNVAGARGGGYPMPQWSGLTSTTDTTADQDIQTINDWILCGAPGPK
jgi:hypothetical protein